MICSHLNIVLPPNSQPGWEVKCLLSDRGRRHPDYETVWGYLPQLRCSFADMQGSEVLPEDGRVSRSARLTQPESWPCIITTGFIDIE